MSATTTLRRSEELLDALQVHGTPWQDLPQQAGVEEKVLLVDSATNTSAGFLRLAPRASLRRHFHVHDAHHLVVVEGTCRVGPRVLRPGAYAFVPSGSEHEIDEAGPTGCLLFFVNLSME